MVQYHSDSLRDQLKYDTRFVLADDLATASEVISTSSSNALELDNTWRPVLENPRSRGKKRTVCDDEADEDNLLKRKPGKKAKFVTDDEDGGEPGDEDGGESGDEAILDTDIPEWEFYGRFLMLPRCHVDI